MFLASLSLISLYFDGCDSYNKPQISGYASLLGEDTHRCLANFCWIPGPNVPMFLADMILSSQGSMFRRTQMSKLVPQISEFIQNLTFVSEFLINEPASAIKTHLNDYVGPLTTLFCFKVFRKKIF